MGTTNLEVFKQIEELAPLHLAESWDNCGMQVGSYYDQVTGVVLTLEVKKEALDLALEVGANLIIVHHPLLFQGVKKIDFDSPAGELIRQLIKHNLTVYAVHTNLDSAPEGLNQYLAQKLGLNDIVVLGQTKAQKLYKLAVFVPESHVQAVRHALNFAGAGHIGNYCDCSFRTPGIGTFRGLEGTNPFIGSTGKLEEAYEYRLETIVPEEMLDEVIASMLQAHPYEEVAYDLYQLSNTGKTYGYARMGLLPQPLPMKALAVEVKNRLGINSLRYSGNDGQMVERIGVVAGAGADMIPEALKQGCQVLITGDVKYHEAKVALDNGLAIIDVPHDTMEQNVVDLLSDYLKQVTQAKNWSFPVHALRFGPLFAAT